ncbi:MAG: serine O-acetyltransferase [Moraxellaceae bacterium]|jgi:serine O-acetyltransferase|nr:serine O-acetyltransferase [Moraxellaceae bacterium]
MFDRLREDVASVFDRDPAARNSFEVLLNYPGIHANVLHRLAHRLWLAGWKGLARFISSFSRFLTGIEIHPGARIGRRFFIDHGMGVVIGETAEIGDDVTLYHGVTLGGTSWDQGKRHPTLGNGVVVGAGAKVIGPILVADGARIGSNAVVTKPVPAGATAVGNPARIIQRDDKAEQARRDFAEKIGFQAYGANPDLPDPVVEAIRHLLDHMRKADARMDRMCEAVGRINPGFCDEKLESLKVEDLEGLQEAPASGETTAPGKSG